MADSRLDVTSEDFDPEAALAVRHLEDVALPQRNVADLDNIKLCIKFVPQAVRDEMEAEVGGIVLRHKKKTDEEKEQVAAKKAFMCQRAAEHMETVEKALGENPIETLIQRVRKGPLMLLRRAYETGRPVDVVTRHARGVKGILRGRVCAFDKYMNLLMADAEEWLAHRARVTRVKPKARPAAAGEGDVAAAARADSFDGDIGGADSDAEEAASHAHAAGVGCHDQQHADCSAADAGGASAQVQQEVEAAAGHGGATQTRHGWQQTLRKRKLARLLLRGDQVVLIATASGPMRLPSRLAHLASNS